jgi:hypothetical protein
MFRTSLRMKIWAWEDDLERWNLCRFFSFCSFYPSFKRRTGQKSGSKCSEQVCAWKYQAERTVCKDGIFADLLVFVAFIPLLSVVRGRNLAQNVPNKNAHEMMWSTWRPWLALESTLTMKTCWRKRHILRGPALWNGQHIVCRDAFFAAFLRGTMRWWMRHILGGPALWMRQPVVRRGRYFMRMPQFWNGQRVGARDTFSEFLVGLKCGSRCS